MIASATCTCLSLLLMASGVLAQGIASSAATIRAGVPLEVVLDRSVRIRHVGDPVQGRLAAPVYVFDRLVLPAGAQVEGHIARIGGVPTHRRIEAILSGNLTPRRDATAAFDSIVLSGVRLPLHTADVRGTAHMVRIQTAAKSRAGRQADRASIRGNARSAVFAFRAPGKMSRLKSRLLAMLPYHRQAWQSGTVFNSALLEPVPVAPLAVTPVAVTPLAVSPEAASSDTGDSVDASTPDAFEIHARLLGPLSSATARKGASVQAVLTQPLWGPGRKLMFPEGSLLLGEVVEAQRARRFHRNGKLLFAFRRMQRPEGTAQEIQGSIDGVEAGFDAHLALDPEGAARVASPKTRFIFPALAAGAAALSLHQDYNSEGVPDQDIGGRAESGAVGLGLIGTVLAQASRPLASTIAFTGAGYSIYTTFLARGSDVVFAANTPIEVSVKVRSSQPGIGQRLPRNPQ
jgi:hypothetical protein